MATNKLTHAKTTWIDVVKPTAQDIEILSKAYSYIHPLNLEDLLSPIERPKLDVDDDYLFLVMHFPLWDAQQRLTRPREVDIILGRGYVITIHDGTLKPLETLYQTCEQNAIFREDLLGGGASHTFYVIVDRLIDYILPILRKVDANIRQIEEDIFTEEPREVIRDITLARRDIIALRRIIRQQVPVLEQLQKTDHPILHEDLEEYFGDALDHIYRARDVVDEHAEVIAGLADTADMLASHRINQVIQVLTVISVVMLPLTLISSVYGMNVRLPLANHPQGFMIIIVTMIIIGLSMVYYFHRRHWI